MSENIEKNERKVVKPYGQHDKSKKEEVAEMFNNISGRYDFLNHFLSLGIDKLWRKKAVRLLKSIAPKKMLDIATGTGDFALEALRLNPDHIVGLDISAGMLEKGREKMVKRKVDAKISMQLGDSENIPFEDASFDAITVGFGVRNFENLEKGLGEMLRVLKPGGKAAILEFSKPRKFPVKQTFGFYSKFIIPFIGRIISKDKAAYTYLPDSVAAFPEGADFVAILNKVGYKNVTSHLVSGGIATIYLGEK
jgi:demethylmenaquinone methyltransferase / 2-methoxy-6-polyprenyl-1,4-benzoquinol methylase